MKQIILKIIRFYQTYISFDTGKFVHISTCRFRPTCSEYSYQAIERYGIIYGSWIGIKRIVRCHPWNKGGWDPVPNEASSRH
jgi:uncharacterized protein